jgi:hypothetical protein
LAGAQHGRFSSKPPKADQGELATRQGVDQIERVTDEVVDRVKILRRLA